MGSDETDTFVFDVGDTGITYLTVDTVHDFVTGVDKVDVPGTVLSTSYVEGTIGTDSFTDAKAAAETLMSDGTKSHVFIAGSADGWLFWNTDSTTTTPDEAIVLNRLNSTTAFGFTDLV